LGLELFEIVQDMLGEARFACPSKQALREWFGDTLLELLVEAECEILELETECFYVSPSRKQAAFAAGSGRVRRCVPVSEVLSD